MCISVRESDIEYLETNRTRYEGGLYYKKFRIFEDNTWRSFMRECCGQNRRGFRKFLKGQESSDIIQETLPRYRDKLRLIQTFAHYCSNSWNVGRAYVDHSKAILPTKIIQPPERLDKEVRYRLGYHAYHRVYFDLINPNMAVWDIDNEYPEFIRYESVGDYFWIIAPVLLSDITACGRHADDRSNERYCVVGRNMLVLGRDDFYRHVVGVGTPVKEPIWGKESKHEKSSRDASRT
jgi:hypothetical protein